MIPTRILFVTNYRSLLEANPYKNVFTERSFEALRDAGVDVRYFDIGVSHAPAKQFASWRSLRREIQEWRPDLLHAQQGTITGFVSVMTFHPTVITYTGTDLLPGASIPRWRTWTGLALSNLSALMAKASIVMTTEMLHAIWWKGRRIFVLPHGVNLDIFKPAPKEEARRQLGLPEDRPLVLFMGWRDPANKGLPLAQATMDNVKSAIPDAEMVMPSGVAPDDVALYMQAADVLLFTSRQEGSPNAVKEAMACNLPVVGVRVGDVEERLAGVENSCIADRDPRKLAAEVVKILRSGRRSDGRKHVAELSWPSITDRMISVYEAVLGRPVVRRTERP